MPNRLPAAFRYLAAIGISYVLTSYFLTIYKSTVSTIFISIIFQTIGLAVVHIIHQMDMAQRSNDQVDIFPIFILLIVAALPISAIYISLQSPGLFDQNLLLMNNTNFKLFFSLFIISTPLSLWVSRTANQRGVTKAIKGSLIWEKINSNSPGIALALLFFIAYFVFAQSVNFPGHYTRDQYFEADISDWITNFTTTPTADMKAVRAVHPSVMVFLKPLIFTLSIPLAGSQLQATFLLNALAGACGVFFIWAIVQQRTNQTSYALIAASMLGASTSHLLFSTMLETYIYSSLALIFYAYLIQNERTTLSIMVPAGVIIFGITVTNFAQACILYFIHTFSIKNILKFIAAVIAITLTLNILQTIWYKNSQRLTIHNLTSEQKYQSKIFGESWQARGQVNLVTRTVLLYGMIAPQPYILTDELGTPFPNFRTFKIGFSEMFVAGYKGIGDITAKYWLLVFLFATVMFVINFIKIPKQHMFQLGLAFCIAFNFLLHLLYGDDPMLYTPNWTYALVLFTTISLETWAAKRWLQRALLALVATMIYINFGLLHQIMAVSLPFFGK